MVCRIRILESNRVKLESKPDQVQHMIPARDDRIVVFYYPILSCFKKMISVSDPNPVLIEIILSVSENYPKVYYDAQHNFCALSILPHEAK